MKTRITTVALLIAVSIAALSLGGCTQAFDATQHEVSVQLGQPLNFTCPNPNDLVVSCTMISVPSGTNTCITEISDATCSNGGCSVVGGDTGYRVSIVCAGLR